MNGLKVGLSLEIERTVEENISAAALGSGAVYVFATPFMIALMEETAMKAVEKYLYSGHTTVGTKVNISHIAATPIGMKVKCIAILTSIDNKALTFSVSVSDEVEIIGTGTHERFIIETERFMNKVNSKLIKN